MARTIGIGHQDFAQLMVSGCFYVDKTGFIREWWENQDVVTLIARPRRFGKTLNMSMLERFFSVEYKGQGKIFEGLSIWNNKMYQEFQRTYPVIILLDEYDTPIQEAYVNGYWDEMTAFIRSLFNSTFKTNPYLFRAVMTGITRISKESVFSEFVTNSEGIDDLRTHQSASSFNLNNLTVITTTSEIYEDSFGFTQQEVWDALAEYGLSSQKESVKAWYDGFVFGRKKDIYNPWSIINYLKTRKLSCYWANTSSNHLVGKLIREESSAVKETMEDLLKGRKLCTTIDEQIIFSQLEYSESAVWSLFLAGGYLKADSYGFNEETGIEQYELSLTNREIRITFEKMIRDWFGQSVKEYNGFIRALLQGNTKEMNAYMNRIALTTFSYFDTGNRPSGSEPERFYHGFVLGLMVELDERYVITSNRESGFGRYDVMLKPRKEGDHGIILEFKVYDPDEEKNLADTVKAALKQIEDKNYKSALAAEGIGEDRIRTYGFGFEGKKVLIG
jgi:hypothetical protein